MQKFQMTQEQYDELKRELESLKEKRLEIQERMAKAREYGDFRHNKEFLDAQNELAKVQQLIDELEFLLRNAEIVEWIIEDPHRFLNHVQIGSLVKVRDMETDEEEEYTIISDAGGSVAGNTLSVGTPAADALMHRCAGSVATVKCSDGSTYELQILSVKNPSDRQL